MEGTLVKGAVYSLIIGLLLGILIYPDTETINNGKGFFEYRVIPLREYIFTVLRFAVTVMFITLIALWVKLEWKSGSEIMEFIAGFFKSFFIVLAIILIVVIVSMFIFNR
ncbi:hypothetical protein EXW96_08360 [Paenibacillus sp. JMULE4]|uniref:hypothetical protein n=1 Tax=Paenibacillus sp. JMULE4 TaxID=2518342 RepID=UPI001576DC9D|nr:hypothetical protein [Paenibacillus sp. JMULE4]NTZ17578.1 hypothetical protein [Paenibacillus sp. JMULE4]